MWEIWQSTDPQAPKYRAAYLAVSTCDNPQGLSCWSHAWLLLRRPTLQTTVSQRTTTLDQTRVFVKHPRHSKTAKILKTHQVYLPLPSGMLRLGGRGAFTCVFIEPVSCGTRTRHARMPCWKKMDDGCRLLLTGRESLSKSVLLPCGFGRTRVRLHGLGNIRSRSGRSHTCELSP